MKRSPTLTPIDTRSTSREDAAFGLPPDVTVTVTGDITVGDDETAGVRKKTTEVVEQSMRELGGALVDPARSDELVTENARYAKLLKLRVVGARTPQAVAKTGYADTLLDPAATGMARAKRTLGRAMYHAKDVEPDVIEAYLAQKRQLLGIRAPLAGVVQAIDATVSHIDAYLDQSTRQGYAAVRSALGYDAELAGALTDATALITAAASRGNTTRRTNKRVRTELEAAQATPATEATPAAAPTTTTTTVQVPAVPTAASFPASAVHKAPPPAPPRGARKRK